MCAKWSLITAAAQNSTIYFRDGYLVLMEEEGISILNLNVAGGDVSVRWSLTARGQLEPHVRERKEEFRSLMNFQGRNDKRFRLGANLCS